MIVPTWVQALVLGIVQGLTEFIPISSSGHLVLVPYLLGWERPGLAFDVALHLGTAGAIVTYFRLELWAMVRGFLSRGADAESRLYRRLGLLLVLGSVPVAVVGLTFMDAFERVFATPPAAAAFLFGTAAILISGEAWRSRRVRQGGRATIGHEPGRRGRSGGHARADGEQGRPRKARGERLGGPGSAGQAGAESGASAPAYSLPIGTDPQDPHGRTLPEIGVREALIVGCAQMLALFPGISRSGTTIMAGVAAGMTRQAATRFAFLLALPALVGAGIVSAPDLADPGIYRPGDIVLGVAAAFVASYLAIRFLVAFVSTERLTGFAKYCIAAGSVGLLAYLVRSLPSG